VGDTEAEDTAMTPEGFKLAWYTTQELGPWVSCWADHRAAMITGALG